MYFAFYFHAGIMDLKCSWVKLPGWPPPALLCLQLPRFLLMSVLCCSQRQRTTQSVKRVFSFLLFQMELLWIFQHNTGICTRAGRPLGLSSCLLSEHKSIANCSTCFSGTAMTKRQISYLGFSLTSCTKRMMTHISLVEKISDDWEVTSEFLLLLRKIPS